MDHTYCIYFLPASFNLTVYLILCVCVVGGGHAGRKIKEESQNFKTELEKF